MRERDTVGDEIGEETGGDWMGPCRPREGVWVLSCVMGYHKNISRMG